MTITDLHLTVLHFAAAANDDGTCADFLEWARQNIGSCLEGMTLLVECAAHEPALAEELDLLGESFCELWV